MRILFNGRGGKVGRAVAPALETAGHELVASLDDAEPPRIASSSDAAKRRLSEREIPGAPRHRWYCSVSLRAKR